MNGLRRNDETVSLGRMWHWFCFFWRGHLVVLSLILIMSVVTAALVVAFPWMWQYIIEQAEGADTAISIRTLAGWMVAVGAAQMVVYLILQGTRTVMNARIEWLARERVFASVTEMTTKAHRSYGVGDIVTRLSDDAGEKTGWFICSGVFRAVESSLVVSASIVLMMRIDPFVTGWIVLPLPLLIVGQAFIQGAMGREYTKVQRAISGINEELSVVFSGIRVVRANRMEPLVKSRFQRQLESQSMSEVSAAKLQQTVWLMYGYGWQLAMVALIIAGGWKAMIGEISIGELVTLEGLTMTLVWPMFDFGMFVSKFKQAGTALFRLDALIDSPSIIQNLEGEIPQNTSVSLQGLNVLSDRGEPLVSNVSLDINSGSMVAVVGAVGAGKSLLLKAILGEIPVSKGALSIGGIGSHKIDSRWVLQNVAYVPQDPVLLSMTIRQNILLGRDVTEEDLSRAISVSRLESDISSLGDGVDTMVGERGVTLSGGQQQRLAIARALVGHPSLLLLDDPTSALDAETEAAFWASLEKSESKPTTVVVTHRISTIERSDAVVVMEKGEVVEHGSFGDLQRESAVFTRVYKRCLL